MSKHIMFINFFFCYILLNKYINNICHLKLIGSTFLLFNNFFPNLIIEYTNSTHTSYVILGLSIGAFDLYHVNKASSVKFVVIFSVVPVWKITMESYCVKQRVQLLNFIFKSVLPLRSVPHIT